jgi:CRP/FNR family transcriptional regulator, anaerobic regulatory protein
MKTIEHSLERLTKDQLTNAVPSILQPVFDCWNEVHPMPEELMTDLAGLTIIQVYKKGDKLLVPGKVANYASFVLKGLAKSYYVREADTTEVITKFLVEGSVITSIFSYYSRKPGNEYIVALEDMTVASLHYDVMQLLFKKHPVLNYIIRIITERYLYFLEVELFNMRKPFAEDRYIFFMKHFPHLMQRLALKDIASYLGMSLETLSRVRGRYRLRNE